MFTCLPLYYLRTNTNYEYLKVVSNFNETKKEKREIVHF